MTRTLMILGLVATLLTTVGGPTLASATETKASNYCQSLPESLAKYGFVPGICN